MEDNQNNFSTANDSSAQNSFQPSTGPQIPNGNQPYYANQTPDNYQPFNGPQAPNGNQPYYANQTPDNYQPFNGPQVPNGNQPYYANRASGNYQPFNANQAFTDEDTGSMPSAGLYLFLVIVGFLCGILWGALSVGHYSKLKNAIAAGDIVEARTHANKILIFTLIGVGINVLVFLGQLGKALA